MSLEHDLLTYAEYQTALDLADRIEKVVGIDEYGTERSKFEYIDVPSDNGRHVKLSLFININYHITDYVNEYGYTCYKPVVDSFEILELSVSVDGYSRSLTDSQEEELRQIVQRTLRLVPVTSLEYEAEYVLRRSSSYKSNW